MITFQCEKCGNVLVMNEMRTVDEYMKDMDYLVDELGVLQEASIQQYLVYDCAECQESHKLTYKEWEQSVRMQVAKQAMAMRKQKMFKLDLNPHDIDPDNGLEYCGQCDGFDDEGNCLVDIIKQCTIRKK